MRGGQDVGTGERAGRPGKAGAGALPGGDAHGGHAAAPDAGLRDAPQARRRRHVAHRPESDAPEPPPHRPCGLGAARLGGDRGDARREPRARSRDAPQAPPHGGVAAAAPRGPARSVARDQARPHARADPDGQQGVVRRGGRGPARSKLRHPRAALRGLRRRVAQGGVRRRLFTRARTWTRRRTTSMR